jgi:hypothetical protein
MMKLPLRAAINLEFFLFHRRLPDLDHPRTFNEKVARRKLCDRDPRMPRLSDKILAKEYVTEVLGAEWVIPTLWSGRELPPRAERKWPIPYVLKASHGSGWNIFVRSPQDEDWEAIEKQTSQWLRNVYGQRAREWLYAQIQPGLLVEPYLGTGEVAPPDYKFLVFQGRTAYIQVDLGRMQTHRQLFYDVNWKRQKMEYLCPWTDEEAPPPPSLAKMVDAANRLGAGFPFVRVDLYEIDGRPLFGEMTFYPNSGRFAFKPESAELELGQMWPD